MFHDEGTTHMTWLGIDSLEWWGVLLLVVAAFGAGWIDAVIGGGGLIQLPALLLVPGMTPVQALATNKLASIFGTATSSVTYARKIRLPLAEVIPMALIALIASIGGASLAASLPADVFTPIIVVVLVVVLIISIAKPSLGAVTKLRHDVKRGMLVSALIGAVIGAYDGLFGPGTGTFLVLALVAFIGLDFLRASAQAKVVNFATNLGALILFIPIGAVVWKLGLLLALANAVGGFLGARTALRKGTAFIRALFLIVVSALIIKLGIDLFTA